MLFGKATIYFALLATLISAIYYLLAARDEAKTTKNKSIKNTEFFKKLGRSTYYATTILVSVATFYLLYLFLTHQFQFKYVYQYSSMSLPTGLLVSSLWAGQQGSFLLWIFMTAIMGLFLVRSSGKFENYSMLFLNIIQAFFLVILIQASPFETGFPVPQDGAGLNPLLQNFWMVIHPPILFIGYAAIAFPLVLSFASLKLEEYNNWIKIAFPWVLISSITLGAGIIIGAFWAYETLGWGGYWGWDPVENSSLIPWLTILALFHGLIIQKRSSALAKTNFFYAIISYVLVLYATFLTRSGVLADFSVHSFQNLGINSLLLLFIGTIIIIGLSLFLPRMKKFPHQTIDFSMPNRENAMVFSVWVFSASAFLVFIGTSSPLISGIFGEPSQVDISFYNKVNLPIGIIMALLMGITPYLFWIEKSFKEIPKRMMIPFALAIISTILISLQGMYEVLSVIFFFAGSFTLWSSLFVLVKNLRVSWINSAAPLAHLGVGIMLIGIVGSGYFSESQRIVLTENEVVQSLGYDLVYKGMETSSDGKNIAEIHVSDANDNYVFKPRLFPTKYNEGMMREPDIKAGIICDLYISPLEERNTHAHDAQGHSFSLAKGQTTEESGYKITFTGFNMESHEGGGHMRVGADLKVEFNNQTYDISPAMIMSEQGRQMAPAKLPVSAETDNKKIPLIFLSALNADTKQVTLAIQGIEEATEEHTSQLIVEFSKKPFMGILWFGTILLTLGTIVAFIKRVKTE
jgi:cytochrome c-type biogenesis protein CcmF